jgi:hypothetical protein
VLCVSHLRRAHGDGNRDAISVGAQANRLRPGFTPPRLDWGSGGGAPYKSCRSRLRPAIFVDMSRVVENKFIARCSKAIALPAKDQTHVGACYSGSRRILLKRTTLKTVPDQLFGICPLCLTLSRSDDSQSRPSSFLRRLRLKSVGRSSKKPRALTWDRSGATSAGYNLRTAAGLEFVGKVVSAPKARRSQREETSADRFRATTISGIGPPSGDLPCCLIARLKLGSSDCLRAILAAFRPDLGTKVV